MEVFEAELIEKASTTLNNVLNQNTLKEKNARYGNSRKDLWQFLYI